MRSLVRQCLNVEDLPASIESRLKTLLEEGSPNEQALEELLREVNKSFSQHYIILDGVEDCSEDQCRALLTALNSLVKNSLTPVKLLISSRSRLTQNLKMRCPSDYEISMTVEKVQSDIETYIDMTLSKKLDDGDLVTSDESVVYAIRDALISRAQGIVLDDLPQDLEVTYVRILSRIARDNTEGLIIKVFKWITVAARPLTLPELAEAVIIQPYAEYSLRSHRINEPYHLVSCCRGLLAFDELNEEVRLAHSTIARFLCHAGDYSSASHFGFEFDDADKDAGILCATYLDFNDFKTKIIKHPCPTNWQASRVIDNTLSSSAHSQKLAEAIQAMMKRRQRKMPADFNVLSTLVKLRSEHGSDPLAEHPFLEYASEHWLSHSSGFSPSDRIWPLWRRLVRREEDVPAKYPWDAEAWLHGTRARAIPTYIVRHGHKALFIEMNRYDEGYGVDVMRWVIFAAAEAGKSALLDEILKAAPVKLDLSKILFAAAEEGHLLLLERLLAAGTDVNARSHSGYRVLHIAGVSGHVEVVKRLLAAGADIDARSDYGDRVVSRRAGKSNFGVLNRQLLPYDDLAAGTYIYTALYAAASRGHVEVVEQLLAAGANVNASTDSGYTALHRATGEGHAEVVERLLAAGANVNIRNNSGYTALYTAAQKGHVKVVERLLAARADVNARSYDDRTALYVAATEGHVEVVERLLAAGADYNARKLFGDPVLSQAAQKGHVKVVERLLAAGADFNARTDSGYTALHRATEEGHVEVVERLLATEANVNARAQFGYTALYRAVEEGHVEVVKRLLPAGADVNLTDNEDCKTPLQAAKKANHQAVVEALRKAGAKS